MRRQQLDQLLCHRSMYTSVEVETDIEADTLRDLESFHSRVEDFGAIEPAHVFGCVHLSVWLAQATDGKGKSSGVP